MIKNINFVYVVRKQCNNEFIFYMFACFIGSLIGKTAWVNLTPWYMMLLFLLAHDKDVQK